MKNIFYIINNGILFESGGVVFFEPVENLKNFGSKFVYEEFSEVKLVDSKRSIPIENTSAICCFAHIQFDTTLINFLNKNNIPLILFANYQPTGIFYPNFSQLDGELTILQSLHYISLKKRLLIAKKFVRGSLVNKIVNLVYYSNRLINNTFQITFLTDYVNEIDTATTVNDLMLIEAKAQKLYFAHFNLIIKNPDFYFKKREYHPPTDPLNALLSLVYSLLYSTMYTEIASTFLNPYISYLHEPGTNRSSLIWDMAEIFKPTLCDRLVFKLINHKMVKLESFDFRENGCYLKKEFLYKVITEFNNKLKTTINNRETKKQQSYRSVIRNEFYKLIRYLKNEEDYTPFKSLW